MDLHKRECQLCTLSAGMGEGAGNRRDARTLSEALKLGAYGPAHRISAARRYARPELAVREALVWTRTR